MKFEVEQHGQVTTVRVDGSVDALTAGEVTDFLKQQVAAGHHRLVVELSSVPYVSSAGLRTILAILKDVRAQNGDLRLANAQPKVLKVLKMSGFTNILKSFDEHKAAVESFEHD